MNEQETIADAIAWLRSPQPGENGYLTAWRDEIADRIEAAWKRERHERDRITATRVRELEGLLDSAARAVTQCAIEKKSIPGNAAKLREALVSVKKSIDDMGAASLNGDPEVLLMSLTQVCARLSARIDSALAAPPRNCDVGTAEEQEDRFRRYCNSRGTFCGDCPLYNNRRGECRFAWAQMPYKEGGAK